MIKQTPSLGRIFAMVAFTLTCFGILVFLWLSFGGAVPLQPEGYRLTVGFPSATQLAQQADVRISGVRVGRVVGKQPNVHTGLTDAVLEIDSRYAPIPKNTRAILRQKTLLGETYVELSPGSRSTGMLPDEGKLPAGQVSDTVELDEILRTFDPQTRNRFTTWFDQAGIAAQGNAEHLNDALGLLTPFAEDTDQVLAVLRQQSGATKRFVRDTGYVFDALTERKGQLRDLISNSNRTWQAIASRDQEFADTFVVLPTFLREGRATTARLTRFAANTNPLIDQLRPAARELSPTLKELDALAPDLKHVFVNLDPLVRVSREGLPATGRVLDNTKPFLRRVDPWLRNFTPIVDYLGLYRREITAFLGNIAAATQGREQGFNNPADFLHYVRVGSPLNPEIMTGWPYRLSTNRSNPYTEPGGYDKLRTAGHLQVFGSHLCTARQTPPTPEANEWLSQKVIDDIDKFVFGGTENRNATPPCDPQAPLGRFVGQPGAFPHLQPLP
jgi:phospholipid/cholesterol/gamma-HCH transport system substrate-binding protein